MSVFGKAKFVIRGDSIGKLLNHLFQENISCKNLTENNGTLTGECSRKNMRTLEELCIRFDLEYEFYEDRNLITALKWLKGRKGLIVGFAAGLALVTYLSNTLLKIRIIGGDEELAEKVETYLMSKGVTYGSFIPKLDFFDLEVSMLHDVEEVSWVGIYDTGGTLNIDIIPSDKKPEMTPKRLPSNIVASHDGQIVSAEVLGGQLVTPVGSGVHKGQLIVSGEVKLSEDKTVYKRSVGKIMAEYKEKVEFECPFVKERKVINESESFKKHYISFFSADIPAFVSKRPSGLYETEENDNKLSFFGIKLPVGVKTVKYTPYEFKTNKYTENQATYEVYRLMSVYEENLLSDCEIKDKKEDIKVDKEGVKLTVEYTVVSDIAQEQEILIKTKS